MKRIFTLMAVVIFVSALFFSIKFNANAQSSPETIIGTVTLVDVTTLVVKEDTTQTDYQFTASPNKLKDVKPGYRVQVKTANGKVLSLTILGMPKQATPEPGQKWKVIVPGK